jgi:putative tryptophan/tyrosine transport system substrate-binding protein
MSSPLASCPVSAGRQATSRAPTSLNTDIAAKRLGLIRQLVPQDARFFVLVNPTSVLAQPFIKDLQAGAASLGLHVAILHASTDSEIDAAFANLSQRPVCVLLVSTDAFFFSRHRQIVALASRRALPAMFDNREYAMAGGLMSYGADFYDILQLAGGYTGRILKGEKPPICPPSARDVPHFLKASSRSASTSPNQTAWLE